MPSLMSSTLVASAGLWLMPLMEGHDPGIMARAGMHVERIEVPIMAGPLDDDDHDRVVAAHREGHLVRHVHRLDLDFAERKDKRSLPPWPSQSIEGNSCIDLVRSVRNGFARGALPIPLHAHSDG